MSGLTPLVEHWGYAAIFAVVILGSVGLPVPEETILTLAGYLVWRGDVGLGPVLIVGIASASVGDNLGYWLGRRFGSAAVRQYGARIWLSPARVEASQRWMLKYGALAVFNREVRAGASFRRRTRCRHHSHARSRFFHGERARRLLLCAAHGRDRLCDRTGPGTSSRKGAHDSGGG